MVRLEKWAVVWLAATNECYAPPESRELGLAGFATGHPEFDDGTFVTSSAIVHVSGRTIRTESGRVYELFGDPDPAYLAWLAENGRSYNPDQPVKPIDG